MNRLVVKIVALLNILGLTFIGWCLLPDTFISPVTIISVVIIQLVASVLFVSTIVKGAFYEEDVAEGLAAFKETITQV